MPMDKCQGINPDGCAMSTQPSPTPVDQLSDGPGISHIDPTDPAASYYNLLANLRSPLTLRALMIQPVGTGYIG